MLQKTVNTKQAFGLVGTFYDDSARRVAPYNVQSNPATASAAAGEITLGANPTANDTVTVADKTYTFKSTASTANDVKIGTNAAGTIANLVAAINGGEGAGTDYGTGTTANAFVTATAGSGKVELEAKSAGAAGNAIALTASFTSASNDVVAFTGGADAGSAAKVGCCFTVDSSDKSRALVGGTGVFAGVLVSPHELVIGGLEASLEVASGTIGQLATFGHVIVKPTNAVSVGYVAAYDNTTGEISGYASAGSIPAGSTQIPNAKFIFVDALANEPAVLELGN